MESYLQKCTMTQLWFFHTIATSIASRNMRINLQLFGGRGTSSGRYRYNLTKNKNVILTLGGELSATYQKVIAFFSFFYYTRKD